MKTFLLTLCLLLFIPISFGQSIEGSWVGELPAQDRKIPLIFNITNDGTGLQATLDSPSQGAKGIPISKVTFVDNVLTIDAKNIGIQYKGTLENEQVNGIFSQGRGSAPLVLSRKKEGQFDLKRPQDPKPPFNYAIEEVTFTNPKDKNTLAGTLTTPKDNKEFPIVILISGSGQQNRDSEIMGHKSFWVIADNFAKKGIGVLRVDDRGTGKSDGLTPNVTSQDFASDTNAAVEFLASRGYKNIGLAGHSEGGMIAPMVAVQNKKVKFIISMAGPGIPVDELLLLQTTAIAKASGMSEAELKPSQEMNKNLYSFVKNYKGKDLKADAAVLVAAEFKKLPKEQRPPEDKMAGVVNKQVAELTMPWFVYFISYNPDANWSKLKIPVLAINGTKDLQILEKENLAGIKKSLEKANNKNFEIQSFEGLNHLFQTANTGSVSEYGTIEETIAPVVLDKMSSWILTL